MAGERPTSGIASISSALAEARLALLGLRQRAADDRGQFLEVEGLRQIFIGAAFGRADRRHEGVLRAHHDDRQIGPQPS